MQWCLKYVLISSLVLMAFCFSIKHSFASLSSYPYANYHFELVQPETLWAQYQEACWFRLGVAYLQNDRLIEALNAFQLALDYNPKFLEAYHNIGFIYFQMGDFQQSALALVEAIKIDPNNAYSHHLLGVIFTIYQMYESALMELERAASINPENPLIQYDLGFAQEFSGSLPQARKSYENAVRLDPKFKEAEDRLKGVVQKLLQEPEMLKKEVVPQI